MTKEESVIKLDEIIRKKEASIKDLKNCRDTFIDIDDELIGNAADFFEFIGAMKFGNDGYELLFHKEHNTYVKIIRKNN